MEKQKALTIIKRVTHEAEEIVTDYITPDKASALAVASAFLGITIKLYKMALGVEGTAVMIYKIADDLVTEIPLEKTFENGIFRKKRRYKRK